MYRVFVSNYTSNCTVVSPDNIYHFHPNGTQYIIAKNNRKASSTGSAVNKIWKKLIQ
jgi:hypothetical protein